MRSFEIKQVAASDESSVLAVARVQSLSNIEDGFPGVDVDRNVAIIRSENQNDLTLIAYVAGVPAGVATDTSIGGALSLWIAPNYRGLGIEDALLMSMETIYRIRGIVKAQAPIGLPSWLNELLHRHGFIYMSNADELVKSLPLQIALAV